MAEFRFRGQAKFHSKANQDYMQIGRSGVAKARKALSIAARVAGIVNDLKTVNPVTVASCAVRAVDVLADSISLKPDAAIAGWIELDLGVVEDQVLVSARNSGLTDSNSSSENAVITADVYGQRVRWIIRNWGAQGPFIPGGEDHDKAKRSLGHLLWRSIGDNLCYQKGKGSAEGKLVPDRLLEAMPSELSEVLHARLDKFMRAGINRAVLLYGEPGTGKSNIARRVASLLGGHTIRVAAGDVHHSSSLSGIVEVMSPDAVVIDDLDRCSGMSAFLSVLDDIKAVAKLIIVTVNDVTKLDPAMLRPGRFDEIVHVEKLDEGVLGSMFVGVPTWAEEQLRKLPVAYIAEFNKIRSVLGDADALAAIQDLVDRSAHITGESIDEEEEEDDDE